MTATYEVRGNVAVITLSNPPVNGLGYETRKAAAAGIARAEADAAIAAVVITGAGKAF
ncbi:MAG TPA: enoyl-CoA hydratase-related protein, partial [Roseateles sp.]|nr:enoyl-CoA hydratase-related protein [Roseateles sp.]